MFQKDIYIIRHGETDFNKNGYLQGATIDSSLNKKGIRQSDAFFERYKNIPFDKIYTSSLKRSIESVKKFIEKGIPTENHPELNEINWGRFEGKRLNPLRWYRLKKSFKIWQKGITDLRFPGGESPEDVARRQERFLEKILSKTEEEIILISMHGRALKILLCLLMGENLTKMDHYKHENLGLYQIRIVFDQKILQREMVINNATDHLKEKT